MKRKLATDSLYPGSGTVGPKYSQEEAERLKAVLRTRADDQFELDKLFAGNPNIRHQTRQKLERLLIQSEAAETMAPGLQRDMSKMAFVTDAEAKILGLEKTALSRQTVGTALGKRMARAGVRYGDEAGAAAVRSNRPVYDKWVKKFGRFDPNKGDIKSHMLRSFKSETKKLKTASIAPNVDAWFEKNASVLKKAGIPSPAIGAKATRITATARPGRVPAQSNLAGGSA